MNARTQPKHFASLIGHTAPISAIKIHPLNPDIIATSSEDCTIKIWSLSSKSCINTLKDPCYPINCLSLSKDGTLLSCGSNDTFIYVYDLTKAELVRVCEGHTQAVSATSFGTHPSLIVSGAYDNCVLLWDTRTSKMVYRVVAHSDPITAVDTSSDDTVIVSGSFDGFYRFWDLTRGVALCSWLLGANIGITHASFMPNPEYALIGGLGGMLGIYEIKTGKKKKCYEGILNMNYPLCHSYGKIGDDFFIFGGSETEDLKVWNMKSEELHYSIPLPEDNQENFAACVDYHEGSQRLAVCGPNSRSASYLFNIPFN